MRKKLFSIALAFMICLNSIINVLAATTYYENQMLDIINSGFEYPLLRFNGAADYDNFAPKFVVWKNPDTGVNYGAYCVNPAYGGYGDKGAYSLDIQRFDVTDDDCIVDAGGSGGLGKKPSASATAGSYNVRDAIEGAIRAGFPSHRAADLYGANYDALGLETPQQIEYGAYLATKMAIWTLIHDSYSNPDSWSANITGTSGNGKSYPADFCEKTYQLYLKIYNAGVNYTPQPVVSATLTAGTASEVGTNWEIPFTIGGTVLEDTDILAGLLNDPADYKGITFKYMDGTDIPKTGMKGRYVLAAGTTEFKVIVPKPGVGGKVSITESIAIYAQNGNKVLLYAKALQGSSQNYVLCGTSSSAPIAEFTVGDDKDTGDPPSGSGNLNILKSDAVTGAALSGVTFDVYNSKGQKVATGTTNAQGCFSPNIKDDAGMLNRAATLLRKFKLRRITQ